MQKRCAPFSSTCAPQTGQRVGFSHRLGRRVVRHRAEDFRNHVVAPAEEHTRADLDAFALDVVVVIQRCPLNRRAREFHRG